MVRISFSPKPGLSAADVAALIAAHAALDTGVHGVGASTVCSETESFASSAMMGVVADIALYFNGITAALAASICEEASLTAARAASIFDEAGLAAQKAADIFDHANLSTAKAVAIAWHVNLTIARYDAISALMADPTKLYIDATLAHFQANAATGTVDIPSRANDNDTAVYLLANVIGEYAEIDFERWVRIDQWRLFGHDNNNNNGEWKIEYYGTDLAWHDWVTGIVTNESVWTSMAAETEVVCDKVRLTCTAVDSFASGSCASELEVYHS